MNLTYGLKSSKHLTIVIWLLIMLIGCNQKKKFINNNCISINSVPIISFGDTLYRFQNLDSINLMLNVDVGVVNFETGDIMNYEQDTLNEYVKVSNWSINDFMEKGCIHWNDTLIKIRDTKFAYWVIDKSHKNVLEYSEFLGKEDVKTNKNQEIIIMEILYASNGGILRIEDNILISNP